MKKSSKIILGSSLAAAVLIGGGAYAATSIFGGSSVDLSTAAPESSVSYLEIDLNPSIEQKVSALALNKKIAAITEEDDNKDTNLMESITKDEFPGLDYEKDIKPWLGSQAANVGFNGEFDNVAVYEIKDSKKAEEVIKTITSKDRVYQVEKDWVVVAKDADILAAYNKTLEGGTTLHDVNQFNDDKKAMGDNVSFAWVNLEKIDTDKMDPAKSNTSRGKSIAKAMPSDIPEMSGRVGIALSLTDNSVNLDAKTFGLTIDGVDSWETTKVGSTLMGNMSDSAIAAVEISDVSNSFKKNWGELKTKAGLEAEDLATVEAGIEESIGVKIPDEVGKILGDNLAFAVNKNKSYALHSDGADAPTWKKIYELAFGGYPSEDGKLESEGSVQKFLYSENFDTETSKGKLSDTPYFKSALPDLNKAQIAGYLDIKEIMDFDDEKKDNGVDEGVVGMTVSYDAKTKQHDMKLRWVLR